LVFLSLALDSFFYAFASFFAYFFSSFLATVLGYVTGLLFTFVIYFESLS
jgi:hypothetical protein